MSVPAPATVPPTVPATRAPSRPITPPATSFPWLGLTAVLMGTFISTLNTRLSTLGLADIRGAVHAGFDEGAWISTAQTVAQMLVTLVAIWLGAIYGTRKALMGAAAASTAFGANDRMWAHKDTFAALNTNIFIPDRNFERDISFFPLCCAARIGPVNRQRADR